MVNARENKYVRITIWNNYLRAYSRVNRIIILIKVNHKIKL